MNARNKQTASLGILLLTAAFLLIGFTIRTAEARFIPIGIIKYGRNPDIQPSDIPTLAKADYLASSRLLWNIYHDQYGKNLWKEIKAINPDIRIFVYTQGPFASDQDDDRKPGYRDNIGRVFQEDSPPSGSLESRNLLVPSDREINGKKYAIRISYGEHNQYIARYGDPEYVGFWHEANRQDVLLQPWYEGADGLHLDECNGMFEGITADPLPNSGYGTEQERYSKMVQFLKNVSAAAHTGSPRFLINPNATSTYTPEGRAAWKNLDQNPNTEERPDILHEEGAFFHRWASRFDIWFYTEAQWKQQVDMIAGLQNVRSMWVASHRMKTTDSGTDNYGNEGVTHWQALHFALASMALGKQESRESYLYVTTEHYPGGRKYKDVRWYPEYDEMDGGKMDFGNARGPYTVREVNGVNLYLREFDNGWVVANPTKRDVDGPVDLSVALEVPTPVRHVSHDRIRMSLEDIPEITALTEGVPAHTGLFLRKSGDAPVLRLPPPENLQIGNG
jgi:hypothetical protein